MRKALVPLAFSFVIFAIVVYVANGGDFPNLNQVTLHAAPGNSTVQMFDDLRYGPDVNVRLLPNNTKCTRIGSSVRFGEGVTAISFYQLKCGPKIGYVNARWVR